MISEYQPTLKQQANLLKYHSTASYLICPSEAEMVDLKNGFQQEYQDAKWYAKQQLELLTLITKKAQLAGVNGNIN